jgi:hypothetical protein
MQIYHKYLEYPAVVLVKTCRADMLLEQIFHFPLMFLTDCRFCARCRIASPGRRSVVMP